MSLRFSWALDLSIHHMYYPLDHTYENLNPLELYVFTYVISYHFIFTSRNKLIFIIWAIPPWAYNLMTSSHFFTWFNKDLILLKIWLPITWLVPDSMQVLSFLHHSHGPPTPKPSLFLHPCLVLRGHFLAIFTLSSHPKPHDDLNQQ